MGRIDLDAAVTINCKGLELIGAAFKGANGEGKGFIIAVKGAILGRGKLQQAILELILNLCYNSSG